MLLLLERSPVRPPGPSSATVHADPVLRVLGAALDADCPTDRLQQINDDFERSMRPALVSYPGTARN